MPEVYSKRLRARWGDMDYNAHMANRAYLDAASDVRMSYFESKGYSMENFEKLRVGPVVSKDVIEYFREIRLGERMDVWFELGAISEDGSQYRLSNTFFNQKGKMAARISSSGGWMDLNRRVLVPPPADLLEVLLSLSRTADFEELKGITRA